MVSDCRMYLARRDSFDFTYETADGRMDGRNQYQMDVFGHDNIGQETEAECRSDFGYRFNNRQSETGIGQNGQALMSRKGYETRPAVMIEMFKLHEL